MFKSQELLQNRNENLMDISYYNDLAKDFSDTLFRYSVKMLSDSELAKDIVQDSFLKLWENLTKVRNEQGRAWLFKTAYNLIVDNARKQSVRYKFEDTITRRTVSLTTFDERQRIDYYLDKLPYGYKTVLLLRDEMGYSYKEIADITSMTLEMVKITVYRARVKMKQYLMTDEK